MLLKKLICKLIGHQPRGPYGYPKDDEKVYGYPKDDEKVVYKCQRCRRFIEFNLKRGWILM